MEQDVPGFSVVVGYWFFEYGWLIAVATAVPSVLWWRARSSRAASDKLQWGTALIFGGAMMATNAFAITDMLGFESLSQVLLSLVLVLIGIWYTISGWRLRPRVRPPRLRLVVQDYAPPLRMRRRRFRLFR